MTSAPSVAELVNRIAALEADVALLKTSLQRTQIQSAVRRGRQEAEQGKMVEATELVASLRSKFNLPTP